MIGAEGDKDVSWLLELFGIEASVNGALIVIGIIGVLVGGVAGAAILLFGGEGSGKKAGKKAGFALGASIVIFGLIGILDVVVTKMQKAGEEIEKEDNVTQILDG